MLAAPEVSVQVSSCAPSAVPVIWDASMRKTKPLVTGNCAWADEIKPSDAAVSMGPARARHFRLPVIESMTRREFIGIFWRE